MKKLFLSVAVALMFLITGCTSSAESSAGPIKKDIDPNKVVIIKDSELEKIIREELDIPEVDILAVDMEEIEMININYKDNPVYELDGLEYAVNLNNFSFRNGGELKSLDPISSLENLEYLGMSYSTLEIMPSEFNAPGLERISFADTNISSYDFLKKSTNMTDIYISSSEVKSLEFITNMNKLEGLSVEYNAVSDITPVKNKNKLTAINLHMNKVTDVSALATCDNLAFINISYNKINNIEYLYNLENLSMLTAYESIGEDIIPKTQIYTLEGSGVDVLYHR